MKIRNRIVSLILVLVLLAGSIPVNVFAAGDLVYGIGFITGSNVRLRSEANTDSKIVETTSKGEVVAVLAESGDWYKVIYDLKEGYIHSDFLDVSTTANAELGYGKINGVGVNLRTGPGTSYSRVSRGSKGDKAYIVGIKDGWYRVIFGSKICYIRSDYLDLTEIPYENDASKNVPLFFRGGKSTGIEVSANALNGNYGDTSTESSNETTAPSSGTVSNSSAKGVKYGIGFVTGSGLRLRESMSTSGKTLDTAAKNEVVVIISKHGDWYKVIYDLKVGYMHGDYLKVSTTANAELGYGKVTASSVKVRSGPSTSTSQLDKASRGEKAYILGLNDGWYRVIFEDHVGYIRSDYLELTEIPYENAASSKNPRFFRGGQSTGTDVSAGALNGSSGSTSSGSSSSGSSSVGSGSAGTAEGNQIVATAKQHLGVPYKWGGTDPSGFDCSGFVYYVLRCNGINVSRTQTAMYAEGTPVSKSDLEPGDVVFFQNTYKAGLSHVGIYVGGGQFIHAPSSGKVVSYADLNSDYYVSHYYGAARYTG